MLLEKNILSIEETNNLIINVKDVHTGLISLESNALKFLLSGNKSEVYNLKSTLDAVNTRLDILDTVKSEHSQLEIEIKTFVAVARNQIKNLSQLTSEFSSGKQVFPDYRKMSAISNTNSNFLTQSDLLSKLIADVIKRKEGEHAKYNAQRKWFSLVIFIVALGYFVFVFYLLQREMKNTRYISNKLRDREERLAVTLSSIDDAVITTNENSAITFMNTAAEQLTGWKSTEAFLKPVTQVFDVIDEHTNQPAENIVTKVLTEGKPVEMHNSTILRSRDNRRIIIERSSTPLKNKDSSIIGSVLVFHDITERKKSELQLKRSEARFSKAFTSSPAPMLISRLSDGLILEANKSFEALLEYTRDELLGKTSYGMGIYADQLQRLKAALKIKKQGYLHNEEIKFKSKRGETKDLLISLETIELDNEPCLLSILIDITERKKTELALIATEKKFRSIFENTADGIYQSTPDGRFIIVNNSMARIFGYQSPEEMIQMVTDIGTQIYAEPSDRQQMANLIKENGSVTGYELKALRKDKSIIWIKANIHTVCDDQGNIVYYEGTLDDISERKAVEETLRKSEEKFSSMVYNIADIIALVDANGIITYVSSSVFSALGYTESDVIGKSIFEFIFPDDRVFVSNELKRLLNNEMDIEMIEFRFYNKAGEVVILEAKGSNQLHNSAIKSIIVNARNITKRKQDEEQLRLNKRAIESSYEGIIITDADSADNEVVFVNEAFLRITGYTASDVLGRNCRFLQGEQSDKNVIAKIRAAIDSKENFEGEILNYKKDKTPFWNFLRLSPIFDSEGNVTHFVGFQNDITQRKLAEQQIEQQNKEILKTNAELDRFVYSTSHDLRAPLTSVLGLLSFIEDESKEPDTLEHASMIRRRIKQLDDFIQNILDYSRNNRLQASIQPIDFDGVIKHIIDHFNNIKNASKIQFMVDVQCKAVFYSDRARIITIIENLVSNSIKFFNPHQEKPFIGIKVTADEYNAVIEVADNGIGIAPEFIDKIFNMFYRVSSAAPGSGLGLYLVKEIIDKLGGTIEVQSAPGIETKFIIKLKNYGPQS